MEKKTTRFFYKKWVVIFMLCKNVRWHHMAELIRWR